MADEVDSKSIDGDIVRVQVPQPALLGRGFKAFIYKGFKEISTFDILIPHDTLG